MAGINKLIVTSRSALGRKYGRKVGAVNAAVRRLIATDRQRGVVTLRVDIDGIEPGLATEGIAAETSRRLTRSAIDQAYFRHSPDYLMILGAQDVVPMQHLQNPMNGDDDVDNDDDDVDVPSDLPYACEPGAVTDDRWLLGPTRVLGRLPDIPGATDPGYLVALLDRAARWTSRPRSDYRIGFVLSTDTWKHSTALSAEKLFNDASILRLSPPSGPTWSPSALAPRIHFINCHGTDVTPKYLGQKGDRYPTAHHAPKLAGRINEGTVVAAECCYGAQLYDPDDATARQDRGVSGIALTYLKEGAWGVFGSTTIAYGPSEGNGQADLICQYFVQAVKDGASLGRAALEARHRFASQFSHLDPADLKTLYQFYLLGDPSIHPVQSPVHALSKSKTYQSLFSGRTQSTGSRMFRRQRVQRTGTNLSKSLYAAKSTSGKTIPAKVRKVLMKLARESGIPRARIRSYDVLARRRIYAVSGTIGGRIRDGGRIVSIILTTENDQIVHVRRVHSR